jgi:hypothetical protein
MANGRELTTIPAIRFELPIQQTLRVADLFVRPCKLRNPVCRGGVVAVGGNPSLESRRKPRRIYVASIPYEHPDIYWCGRYVRPWDTSRTMRCTRMLARCAVDFFFHLLVFLVGCDRFRRASVIADVRQIPAIPTYSSNPVSPVWCASKCFSIHRDFPFRSVNLGWTCCGHKLV